jgi:hypothetical protein
MADSTMRVVSFSVNFSGDKSTSVTRTIELTMTDVEFGSAILSADQRLFEMHWNADGSAWEQTPAERLDIIRQENGFELYRYTNRLSGAMTELIDDGTVTEEAWFSFFTPATLNYNREGDRLAQVLTTRSVKEQLQMAAVGTGWEPDKKPTSTQIVCGVAGTVGKLKCMFGGGVANALCHVAVGVSICCAIMALCS